MTLGQLGSALRRRAWWVLCCGLLGCGASVAYLAVWPPRYESTMEIVFDPRGLRLAGADPDARQVDRRTAVALVESQVAVLRSAGVLAAVVDRLRLDADPEFVGESSPLETLRRIAGVPVRPARERALRSLRASFEAARRSRTFVIAASARSTDPDKALRIMDAASTAYLQEEKRARQRRLLEASRAVADRIPELAERVEAAEADAERFANEHDLVRGGRLVEQGQLHELNQRLVQARAQSLGAEARVREIARMEAAGDDLGGTSDALASPVLATLRSQSAALARREADAAARLGDRHPEVRALTEQRKRNDALAAEEIERLGELARRNHAAALAAEEALARRLQELETASTRSARESVGLRQLARTARAERGLHEAFLVRGAELGERAGLDLSGVRVITQPTRPDRPATPRLSLVGAGLTAGLMLGAASVVLRSGLGSQPTRAPSMLAGRA